MFWNCLICKIMFQVTTIIETNDNYNTSSPNSNICSSTTTEIHNTHHHHLHNTHDNHINNNNTIIKKDDIDVPSSPYPIMTYPSQYENGAVFSTGPPGGNATATHIPTYQTAVSIYIFTNINIIQFT